MAVGASVLRAGWLTLVAFKKCIQGAELGHREFTVAILIIAAEKAGDVFRVVAHLGQKSCFLGLFGLMDWLL